MAIDITFYRAFSADILAGRKIITIRDHSEAGFLPGQRLRAGYQYDQQYFATLRVIRITPVLQSQLTGEHARQENMSLPQLHKVIATIYPQTEQLFVIEFCLCEPAD
ncbi:MULTISPECIES: N(4)-acetylcytidine aminohydrolase [unclassified Tatumella]|uniref:N(4)-acetylcytidine aminohydrolase n=1 Tax=unclassified Tatumella TaxID=2649542 RepID=UPI001BAF53F4|nr:MULTISPECIES: N(4)-acetylcytidine aminohydrolase [unclassified Tatumella]MBS0877707.1 ASCH domain-containing protein [Tatumella sp. JGM82]MBS0891412.1 ASCH domain-containing protein [Tatumella sp. JGM94]MBS0902240.1 ASCH domain-containing protein [Tatumella sp. JGM100]